MFIILYSRHYATHMDKNQKHTTRVPYGRLHATAIGLRELKEQHGNEGRNL